jgi:hypothetical protein
MISEFKNYLHRLYPTELENSIDTILYRFENKKEDDVRLIGEMLKQLQEKIEFERFLSYNVPDDNFEEFKIKDTFKNEKYEEQLEQLVHMIHINNGVYDIVLKRIREYHENLHNKSRIAETLKKVSDYEKEKASPEIYLKRVI